EIELQVASHRQARTDKERPPARLFPSCQRAPGGQWLSSSPPTPVQLQDAKGGQGVERDADQRMSEAAMMGEARDWINEIHDHVNVGNFCGDDHGRGGQGRLAVEA